MELEIAELKLAEIKKLTYAIEDVANSILVLSATQIYAMGAHTFNDAMKMAREADDHIRDG